MTKTIFDRSCGSNYWSKISCQIAKKSARLVLGEYGTVETQIPKINIRQVLGLHTQSRRSSEQLEPVAASQRHHRSRRGLCQVIDAGRIGSKVQDRDVG